MLVTPAFAQAAGGAGGTDLITSLLPIVFIFVIFYFLLIRPQQKRQKEHTAMVNAVSRGDVVVTAGGLVGKCIKVHDEEIEVEIAKDVKVRVVKGTLADVRSKTEPANDAK
ncbi:MAG: preprotein translocase subunit YajC [Alphaproteobacteria bacterium]